MNITIFGSGYVGLVTGVCFAEMGNNVLCVDIDADRVQRMQAGECPIYEPGLTDLMRKNIAAERLAFTTEAPEAIDHGQIIFIAVGTPPQEDGSADMQYVLQVAKIIGQHMQGYKVIVNKSTVPVGTADRVATEVQAQLDVRNSELEFDVVSNPEFLKEGCAVSDCMKPDRIVVGVPESGRAEQWMRELYAPFNRNHDKLMLMDVRSAELTKYAANAMLATKISFMNEMSQIAERVGADIEKVRVGIGSDPRIGFSFIYPGCGYGGSCFPKDVQALRHLASQEAYSADILSAVHNVNERQKQHLLHKIKNFYGDNLRGKTFAVWGLAFKPNTDDVREAPSLVVIEALLKAGAHVQAYDNIAGNNFIKACAGGDKVKLVNHAMAAVQGASSLLIFTENLEFRSPDFDKLAQQLADKAIFDGRNLYEPKLPAKHGLRYFCIGR